MLVTKYLLFFVMNHVSITLQSLVVYDSVIVKNSSPQPTVGRLSAAVTVGEVKEHEKISHSISLST